MGLPRSRATIIETWCCYIGEASRDDISGSYINRNCLCPFRGIRPRMYIEDLL